MKFTSKGNEKPTGLRPRIHRSKFFKRFLFEMQTVCIIDPCCQNDNSVPDIVNNEPFMSVTVSRDTSATLDGLISNYYNNGIVQHIRCNCGKRLRKVVKDTFVRAPEAFVVYALFQSPQSQNQIRRPVVPLGSNVFLDTVEDGVVEYTLINGAQHIGSILR